MANVDIALSPAPFMASILEPQSPFIHSHTLIVSDALSIVETCNLLSTAYEIAWQTLYAIHTSYQQSLAPSMRSPSSNSGRRVANKQRGPPQPDPEPAAPPIIILSQSGNAVAPHLQVPDAADQGLVESGPFTSSLSQQQQQNKSSRYNLRSRSNNRAGTSSRPPSKPQPDPNPHPAPPVIILSTDRRSTPLIPAAPSPPIPAPSPSPPSHPSQLPPIDSTSPPVAMGSKLSKVKNSESKGAKLQPSQERQDKEEMKEPSNYYTHRSKSMRRKADQGAGSAAASGGSGGGLS
ncbi:hypothetical protein DDE83_002576 [Stemphylium lycopersici]|uniref:Uncharacterized protein n=1 Tax=Stemphylium lycopersici TaxID=183478 RepID=A0A364N9Z4_STELY|nr:hypothetical protein DDE83_002576 [Stemphylium lycopersici]